MARILGAEKNTLRLHDNIGGGEIELYYRSPTTAERAAYSNESIVRKRNKVDIAVGETRQKYGELILLGIREGDFEYGGKPISSDPTSQNYCDDWKTVVCEYASDLVELLAIYLFEAPSTLIPAQEDPEKN